MKTAFYGRFSSDKQKDTSPEQQLARCREFAERQGWPAPLEEHTFIDRALSGATTAGRYSYLALLEAIDRREFDVLLTDELSRLSRDTAETAKLMKRLAYHEVGLVAVSDGLNTVANRKTSGLLAGIKGALNEEERRIIGERTKRGLADAIRRGYTAGGRPFGYTADRIETRPEDDPHARATLVGYKRKIIPEEAEVVKQIFRLYGEGLSGREIANLLNREGVPPPGRRWKNRKGLAACKWAYTAIDGNRKKGTGIPNNRAYIGELAWNRTEWRKHWDSGKDRPFARPKEDWVIKEMPELRIIEQDLWDRVKALQEKRGADRRHVNESVHLHNKYLLSGLVRCGVCGAKMVISGVKGGNYSCATRRHRGIDTCPNSGFPNRAALEAKVCETARERLYQREALGDLLAITRQALKGLIADGEGDGQDNGQRQRMQELDREIGNVRAAIRSAGSNGAVSMLAQDLAELVKEKQWLTGGARAAGLFDREDIDAMLAEVPAIVEEAFRTGDLSEITDGQQTARARMAMAELVKEIVVRPGQTEEGRPGYVITITGDLQTVLRLAARKQRRSCTAMVAGAGFGADSESVPLLTAHWLYAGVRQGTRGMQRLGLAV